MKSCSVCVTLTTMDTSTCKWPLSSKLIASICSDEFIDFFMDMRNEKLDAKDEIMRKILDSDRMEAEAAIKLEESKSERINPITEIREDAKLKVHIVDANYLAETASTFVRVIQDKSMSQTNVRVGSGPIWNEAIVFDIRDPTQPLIVQLRDQRETILFESIVDLTTREIKDYSLMGQDLMCYEDPVS